MSKDSKHYPIVHLKGYSTYKKSDEYLNGDDQKRAELDQKYQQEYASVYAYTDYLGYKYDKALAILKSHSVAINEIMEEPGKKMFVIPISDFKKDLNKQPYRAFIYTESPDGVKNISQQEKHSADEVNRYWINVMKDKDIKPSNIKNVIQMFDNEIQQRDAEIDYLKSIIDTIVVRKIENPFDEDSDTYQVDNGKYNEFKKWLGSNNP